MLRKLKLTLGVLCFTFTVGSFSASAQTSDAGSVRFALRTGSDFDVFTNALSPVIGDWLNKKIWRMQVSAGYFDSRLSWYPNALIYKDLYGIPYYSPIVSQHPDWILKDRNGNMLYVPFACDGQGCSQFAGDPGNANFRNWWIQNAAQSLSLGYKGLWIDDVNMYFQVGDGSANRVAPRDPRTGMTMTYDAWRNYIAGFTQQIRSAFPDKEITHNVIWFSDDDSTSDPAITRQIQSADYVVLERGISDGGLVGDNGPWSVNAYLNFIDYVHRLGRGVIIDELSYNGEYPLAGYFLTSTDRDAFGNNAASPDNWWSGYDVHLGTPQGNRYVWNGLLRRDFSGGMVLLNLPGHSYTSVNLPGSYQRIDGSTVSSIGLGGSQGAVLISTNSTTAPRTSTSTADTSSQYYFTAVAAVDSAGPAVGGFSADAYVTGGHGDTIQQFIDRTGVGNAAPETVYQTKRTSDNSNGFVYNIPNLNPGQTYTVRMHFADDVYNYAGGRIFNVSINGNTALSNFDIFVAAGNHYAKAVVKDVAATADSGGTITIQYTPVRANALSSGIEIVP
jgi:hypothetical protein